MQIRCDQRRHIWRPKTRFQRLASKDWPKHCANVGLWSACVCALCAFRAQDNTHEARAPLAHVQRTLPNSARRISLRRGSKILSASSSFLSLSLGPNFCPSLPISIFIHSFIHSFKNTPTYRRHSRLPIRLHINSHQLTPLPQWPPLPISRPMPNVQCPMRDGPTTPASWLIIESSGALLPLGRPLDSSNWTAHWAAKCSQPQHRGRRGPKCGQPNAAY